MREKDLPRIVERTLGTQVVARRVDEGQIVLHVTGGSVDGPLELRATWLSRGWPADVRNALERHPGVDLLVAPRLSVGARRELSARGVGWIDATGAADIRVPGLIVRLDGEAPPPDTNRELRWSDAAVVIAEALLALRPPQISTRWVAMNAACSVPTAGSVLKAFDDHGWTVKHGPSRGPGAHRILGDADDLLATWSQRIATAPLEKWFAHSTERDAGKLRRRISKATAQLQVGWTGWAAGELVAPFTTHVPVLQLRVAEHHARAEVADALSDAGVRMTEDAGRIEVWLTDERALRLKEAHGDEPTCSWARVYADLIRLGGRGTDAAAHLRDVVGFDA